MTVTGTGENGRPPRVEVEVPVDDADAAVRFYTAMFRGVESSRECLCDGQILHADIRIGDYLLSVGTPWSPGGQVSDHSDLCLTGADLEEVLRRFAGAGARVEQTEDAAVVGDMFGHRWHMVRAG